MELLRRMGWREGQGVGPRVKRKARRLKSGMYEVTSYSTTDVFTEHPQPALTDM